MTALDVTPFVTDSEDTPDLRAFKQKVYQAAQDGIRRYGYCNEINRQLADLGIAKEPKITVHVTTTHPFEFDVPVHPSLLLGKDEEAQKQVIVAELGDLNVSSKTTGSFKMAIPASSIAAMSVVDENPEAAAEGTPLDNDRFIWRYSSVDGRVLHRFRAEDVNSRSWIYSSCSTGTSPSSLTMSPHHPTDRRCTKCRQRMS